MEAIAKTMILLVIMPNSVKFYHIKLTSSTPPGFLENRSIQPD
jgi:hypothetical protein